MAMTDKTLAESVAASLRDLLVQGVHVPGERLVEIAIAREIGVSQNTVRDALRLLEQDGWVVKHPRRGVFVRAFTLDEVDEVYALLSAVESVALEWVMDSLDKSLRAELSRHIADARRAALTADAYRAQEALFAFHEGLGRGADKSLTAGLLRQLLNYARLLEALRQSRTPGTAEDLDAQVSAHETLLRHMDENERSDAHIALHRILNRARDAVLPALEI